MYCIGHMRSASLLVLRLTNVHLDADAEAIRHYFKGYRIFDQIRAINPKTRYLSVVYVMFASVEERNRAYKSLNMGTILSRQIHLMPAHTGNYRSNLYATILLNFTDNIRRVNASHNGFVHDGEEQKVAVNPEPAAFKGLSNSDFPALGNVTHTCSLQTPISPKHHVTHRRISKNEHVGVVDSIGPPLVLSNTVAAGLTIETGDVAATLTAVLKTPSKSKEQGQDQQTPSHEEPRVTLGIENRVLSGRAPLIANRNPQPAPEFSRGISEWLWNIPSTLQNHYLNWPLPPPNPSFNQIVNGPPIPPFPRDDPHRAAHDHLIQLDFNKAYAVFKKAHVPLVPLGGLWNLSRNADPASNIVSESEWYDFMLDLGRENRHRQSVGQAIVDRINCKAGYKDDVEKSVDGEPK